MDPAREIGEAVRMARQALQQQDGQQGVILDGIVRTGGCVEVQGRIYPYRAAVDVPIYTGAKVYVAINEGKTMAVVVGT